MAEFAASDTKRGPDRPDPWRVGLQVLLALAAAGLGAFALCIRHWKSGTFFVLFALACLASTYFHPAWLRRTPRVTRGWSNLDTLKFVMLLVAYMSTGIMATVYRTGPSFDAWERREAFFGTAYFAACCLYSLVFRTGWMIPCVVAGIPAGFVLGMLSIPAINSRPEDGLAPMFLGPVIGLIVGLMLDSNEQNPSPPAPQQKPDTAPEEQPHA